MYAMLLVGICFVHTNKNAYGLWMWIIEKWRSNHLIYTARPSHYRTHSCTVLSCEVHIQFIHDTTEGHGLQREGRKITNGRGKIANACASAVDELKANVCKLHARSRELVQRSFFSQC